MRGRRKLKNLPSDSSDDDEPLSKLTSDKPKEKKPKPANDDSSSESDIENYLQPINKIDLNSPFFNLQKDNPPSFDKIEGDILAGVSRLTDSESEDEPTSTEQETATIPETASSKVNFSQLHEYTKKMEEAKRKVEEYNKRKRAVENETDIQNLIAAVEMKSTGKETEEKLNSSDFESCSDSEKEGWEEVAEKQKEEKETDKKNLEITVEMPGAIKKKKDVDLMATIKRRINRIRKENQVLVHKVHLLCWIAHGNYVNSKINSENVLGVALSLLPSQQCYPADRTDLKYLEQILKWFRNTVENVEKTVQENKPLDELLQEQISKKQAYNKTMSVYIFVAILRALGIQCRLVFSLQVEPLRPPNSELHSLSTKNNGKADSSKASTSASTSGTSSVTKEIENKEKKVRAKSTSEVPAVKATKTRAKSTSEVNSKNMEEKVSQTKVDTNSEDKTKAPKKNTISEAKSDGSAKTRSSTRVKNANDDKEKLKTNIRSKSSSEVPKKTNDKEKPKSERVDDNTKTRNRTRPKSTSDNKELFKATRSKNIKITNDEGKTKSEKNLEQKDHTTKGKSKTNTRSKSTAEDSEHKIKKKTPKIETLSKNTKNEKGKPQTRSKSTGEAPKTDTTSSNTTNKNFTVKIRVQDSKGKAATSQNIQSENKRTTRSQNTLVIPQVDGANDTESSTKPNLKKLKQTEASCPRNHPKRLKTVTKYKDSDSEEDFETTRSPFSNKSNDSPKPNSVNLKKLKNHVPKSVDVRDDIINLVKKSIKQQKDVVKSKTVRKRKSGEESDDSDYVPEVVKKKRNSEDDFSEKIKVKRRVQVKKDAEEETVKKKKGMDVWAEVFLETEEKWISVDVVKGQVHCVSELYARASHPVSYIVAWNNDNTIKDITRRYCTNFNTVTRKLRTDAKWWEATVKPFMGPKTARDKEEDDELERQQLEKPLPTSIAEYKNHPLYVLKRHLLKFEALYPPDPPPLGFVRNEPVYSRSCVYILHSRDIWLKHAKVVKPGEKPYKIVKARPKWDKLSNSVITDQMLEVFGPWQTQDYEPPTAENGIVPRNAFGNVELFKPCMLPKKTVHLKLPGLNKVAKRMNIDCAPALTGFDFHGGWNHPTYEGYIVCEEFADVLVAAWELEQEEIEKREQEKIDKRVYGNWKKLIRGLLIRERLKAKYEFGEPSGGGKAKKKTKGGPKFATKKRKIESDSDSD